MVQLKLEGFLQISACRAGESPAKPSFFPIEAMERLGVGRQVCASRPKCSVTTFVGEQALLKSAIAFRPARKQEIFDRCMTSYPEFQDKGECPIEKVIYRPVKRA